MNKRLIGGIIFLIALVLTGCSTQLSIPLESDLADTGISPRLLEQYRQYRQQEWDTIESPSVPEGYWESGFTNFSGQDNPEENIAGLEDPTVYEVEFYEDWRTIEPEEGLYNWKPIDDQIALWGAYGKKVAIRIVTASHNTMETPQWLHEKYQVRKITDGIWIDFDQPKKIYELAAGEITDDRALAITGRRSLYGSEPGILMSIKEGKLERGKLYGIEFDYRTGGAGTYFLRATSQSGGADADRYFRFDTPSAQEGTQFWSLQLGPYEDYILEWGLLDGSPISIDNILMYRQEYGFGKTVGYPNYFDPIFKEKWENFITALAERYRDNEVVETICVSGHGRYGELGIEGDEAGLHDLQWLALGFTQERYMDHVQSNIELFRRLFPEKKLRMVAGGTVLPDWTDENYIYYRGINMCAEYGVEFKINGMQEAFGVWGTNAFSYGASRYRDDPNTSISIETAGQIYRNNTGKITVPTGQAVSVLNRVMIDGMDNMYLYSHDALSSTVRKYLPYAADQMGHEMFTGFYTRFGVFREPSSLLNTPVDFTDIWLGLYQNNYMHLPGIPAQNLPRVVVDGEHAIRTSGSMISLDMDDRKQYHGLFGATISVSYLDEGNDRFSVLVNDSSDGVELRSVGTVEKHDSGSWKIVTFYDSAWHQSYRNVGHDSRSDVVIDDLGDGNETIRLVEINAVPAQSWRYSTLLSRKSEASAVSPVSAGQVFSIEAVGNIPAVRVRIPLFSEEEYLDNAIRLALYGIEPDESRTLLSDKELYFARTGLVIEFPLYEDVSKFSRFEVEVIETRGPVYLEADENGYLSCMFDTLETVTATGQQAGTLIDATRPFYGLVLKGQFPDTLGSVSIQRLLPSSDLEPVWMTIEEDAQLIEEEGQLIALFEPQTEGFYRVSVDGRNVEAAPRYLLRAIEPKGTIIPEPEASVLSFSSSELARSASYENITVELEDGSAWMVLGGVQPSVTIENSSYEAGANQQVRLALSNPTGNSILRLYWKGPGQDYAADRSIILPVVPNDPTKRTYSYPLGDTFTYEGQITGLRLVLADGGLIGGKMALDSFSIIDPEVLYQADFDGPVDRYIKYADWKPAEIADGQMALDGMLAAASSVITYPDYYAQPEHEAVITLTNLTDAQMFEFGWEKALWDQGDYVFTDGSAQIPIEAYEQEPQTVVIPLGEAKDYEGRIRRLRLQFDNVEEAEGILIDSVTIRRR